MMKRNVLGILLIALCLPFAVQASLFELELPEERRAQVEFDEFVSYHINMTNLGAELDSFRVSLTGDDVPADWTTSICVGVSCLPPFVRSTSFIINGLATDSILVDFQPLSEGRGSVWLLVESLNEPFMADSAEFVVLAGEIDEAGFEFDPPEEIEVTVEVGEFHSFHSDLTNTGTLLDTFDLFLYGDDYPDDWTTSLCFGPLCLPPFIREHPGILEAGASDTLLVDFSPGSEGTGTLWLKIQSRYDPSVVDSLQFILHAVTNAVQEGSQQLPQELTIETIYPNPFNNATTIHYSLPKAGNISIQVYDLAGRTVSTHLVEAASAGRYTYEFQATANMASGIYILQLQSASQSINSRMIYLK
ncbi:T9SS type A sorting domain-containing protein [bacterium]|nr:T9SS type A sorting domain-containing protein [bacterium]